MTTKLGLVLLSNTSNAALGVTRERLDLTATTPPCEGGLVAGLIQNGATGPTAQAVVRIMAARKQTAMPAAGPEGMGNDDWRTIAGPFGGGIVAGALIPFASRFGPEIAYLQIEVSGNTGQPVGVSAIVHAHG